MRVYVESVWDCDPDYCWDRVQQSATLVRIAWPLIALRPVGAAEFPPRWTEGATIECGLLLFNVVPLGVRRLCFESIDDRLREIQTRESDPVVRRWDHLIRVEPADGGRTRYSDTIEVEAGALTPLVWLFAKLFYRYRQRRWRAIVAEAHDCR